MAKKSQTLTTADFSKNTGIPVAAVSRLLRTGKIKGEKVSGRWLINRSQLQAEAVLALRNPPDSLKIGHPKVSAKGPAAGKQQKSIKPATQTPGQRSGAGAGSSPSYSAGRSRSYTVAEFSSLTYLTEYGVVKFLKDGRLKGVKDNNGQWRLSADNLASPAIRHLIR